MRSDVRAALRDGNSAAQRRRTTRRAAPSRRLGHDDVHCGRTERVVSRRARNDQRATRHGTRRRRRGRRSPTPRLRSQSIDIDACLRRHPSCWSRAHAPAPPASTNTPTKQHQAQHQTLAPVAPLARTGTARAHHLPLAPPPPDDPPPKLLDEPLELLELLEPPERSRPSSSRPTSRRPLPPVSRNASRHALRPPRRKPTATSPTAHGNERVQRQPCR